MASARLRRTTWMAKRRFSIAASGTRSRRRRAAGARAARAMAAPPGTRPGSCNGRASAHRRAKRRGLALRRGGAFVLGDGRARTTRRRGLHRLTGARGAQALDQSRVLVPQALRQTIAELLVMPRNEVRLFSPHIEIDARQRVHRFV